LRLIQCNNVQYVALDLLKIKHYNACAPILITIMNLPIHFIYFN